MPTISTLAVKVLLDTANFTKNAAATISTTRQVVNALTPADNALKTTASIVDKATVSFQRINGAAAGYLRTMLGIGAGGATVARAIRAFSDQQQFERKIGAIGPDVIILVDAWDRLTSAVNKAFVAFGRGLNETGNLTQTLTMLISAVENLAGAMLFAGRIAGYVWNFLFNFPPTFLFLAGAIKVATIALTIYAHILITRAVVGTLTYILLGQRMSVIQLLIASRFYIMTAATYAWTFALAGARLAMSALIAIGTPAWVALSIVIGAVVGVTLALVYAWNRLVGSNVQLSPRPMQELGDAAADAASEVSRMNDELLSAIRNLRFGQAQRELMDFENSIRNVGDFVMVMAASFSELSFATQQLGISDPMEDLVGVAQILRELEIGRFKTLQDQRTELQKQADVAKTLSDLSKEYRQAGMTDTQKRLDDLAAQGASASQLEDAAQTLAALEKINQTQADRVELARTIADIENEASLAGLSDMEKRLELARRLGATEEEIARIRAAQAAIDDASRMEEERRKQEQYFKDLESRGKSLTESLRTPFEELQAKLQDVERLRLVGAISDQTARRATEAANAEFRQSLGRSSFEAASPQALLKGSAEASLAANRATNPIENLTKIQREQLAEAKKMTNRLDGVLTELQDADVSVVNF